MATRQYRKSIGQTVKHEGLQHCVMLAILSIPTVMNDREARAIINFFFGDENAPSKAEEALYASQCQALLKTWLGANATGYSVSEEVAQEASEIIATCTNLSFFDNTQVMRVQQGDLVYLPHGGSLPFKDWYKEQPSGTVVKQHPLAPTGDYLYLLSKGYIIPPDSPLVPKKGRGKKEVELD